EVEQEQRRLSHYQTVKADCRSTASDFQFSESEIAGKHVGSNAQSSCLDLTKTSSRAKKYVVDNSKPRTDLEYDPLSNFSADLRSYSSSGKEQKVKNGQCLKKEREAVSCDQNKPAALAQLSQTSPPEPLDESNEDGILVIDIPPSPDKKRGGTPKLDDCVPGKSGIKKECKRSKAVLQYSPTLSKNKGSENKPVDRGVIDLTDCLDDAGSECQITCQTAETEVENNIEPESLPAPSDQHQCWNSLVGVEEEKPQLELSQCEVSGSDEKMNPLEPHQFPSGNSLFNETQAANSGLSCRQNTKDAQSIDLLAHKIPGQIQERAVSPTPSASHKEQEDPTSGTKQSKICLASSADSHLIKEYQTSTSDIAEQLLNKGCDEKVIVISSSEEEFHYSDVEFSDSDPMEECYRIFMEANNEDNGNEKQPTVSSYGQPLPTKRKLKQQSEAAKVPHDVRQRYVNMFTEEFLKTSASVNDAFEKAVTEERGVYNRSANKLKYTSIAVNLLKRLKNQSAASSKGKNLRKHHTLLNLFFFPADDVALYECLKDYILAEERLIESNYPVQHPEKPGSAALFSDNKKSSTDSLKRICCRCGATYSVSQIGKHIRKEECNYHYGKGVTKRVPGGVETRYSCCEGVIGAPGCQVFKLHVHDTRSLDGFVSTIPRHLSDKSCPGVYSLNCEMCYTVHGLELSRVTVVNSRLQVVYDTFVRPDSEVIDYNTRFSGISEEDVKGNNTSIQEVQETLLSFIYADTILIGHSLETDLCALKLLHGMVVDTSVVFPHRLGHPHKLTLNNLTAEYLRRIIQESVCGHDTAEDATACMELMLWKLKEDGKLKK
uniref:Zgc:152968 n=1 Tax=Echeneis naucrates TaxID=173247 RepID=A0A665WZZ6_ECHNA